MGTSIRLRPWQRRALEAFHSHPRPDFLAVATPGAGKTTFALTAAAQALHERRARGLVVVAPTQHLKAQWSDSAARFGLHLDPAWSPRYAELPPDLHGIVTTYAQLATAAEPVRAIADGGFVILDEIHHAGDDRAWGEGVQRAAGTAALRLSLSGTPFRSDTTAIPFVDYHLEEARSDFDYGYGDALVEGSVVRPVFFPRIGGLMEWIDHAGDSVVASFDDELDRQRANQRLRTALSLEGDWLPKVLVEANDQLTDIRRTQPDAGGLVIAIDQDHARGIAELLRQRCGVKATVAVSDDPSASERISTFAAGSDPWIVAVRMVSEGVDIPRLRVGVFATNTTTELFFRQAVGRLVRWFGTDEDQAAYFHIPDDLRLRRWAEGITEQRRHSLKRRRDADDGDESEFDRPDDARALDDGPEEQMSLFAAVSAIADDTATVVAPNRVVGVADGHDWSARVGASDLSLEIRLDPPPLPNGQVPAARAGFAHGSAGGGGDGGLTRTQLRTRLRDRNATAVRELVRAKGLDHRQINAELNRLSGIRKVTEATVEDLQRRLDHANKWLANR